MTINGTQNTHMQGSTRLTNPAGIAVLTVCLQIGFVEADNCDQSLDGAWDLDYQHYLDRRSKGDPDLRIKLDQVHQSAPFMRFIYNEEMGTVIWMQKYADGWDDHELNYRVYGHNADSCFIEYSSDRFKPAMLEVSPIRFGVGRYCMRPSGTQEYDDCYIQETAK